MQNPSIYHLFILQPLPEVPHLRLLSFYLLALLGGPCPLSNPRQPSRLSVPGDSQGRVRQEAQSPLSIIGRLTQFGIVSNMLNKEVGGRGGARGMGFL